MVKELRTSFPSSVGWSLTSKQNSATGESLSGSCRALVSLKGRRMAYLPVKTGGWRVPCGRQTRNWCFSKGGQGGSDVLGKQLQGNGATSIELAKRGATKGLPESLSHLGRLESPWGGGVEPGTSQRRERGRKEMAV